MARVTKADEIVEVKGLFPTVPDLDFMVNMSGRNELIKLPMLLTVGHTA